MRIGRLVVALTAVLAACGTDEDSRPPTLEVVTLTVLAPTCGQPQCHSTNTRTEGYAFDTVHEANAALWDMNVTLGAPAGKPLDNDLWYAIIGESTQMPPDSPLAAQDIELIRDFLVAGAPGVVDPNK